MYIYTFSWSECEYYRNYFVVAECLQEAIEALFNDYKSNYDPDRFEVLLRTDFPSESPKRNKLVCTCNITINYLDEKGEIFYSSEYDFAVMKYDFKKGVVYSC